MNEIALANFYRVLNNEDRFPKEHELAEAAIAAKDELNALRSPSEPQASVRGAADERCITQTISIPLQQPTLTDAMCRAWCDEQDRQLDILTKKLDASEEDDGLPYDREYLQAVWDAIWRAIPSAHPAQPPAQVDALAIVAKHRRHVELSPGVGVEKQRYAIACLDDVKNELERRHTHAPQTAAPATQEDEPRGEKS